MNLGAYSQRRTIQADKLVALPDGIEDQTAAAMMLKGMTVMYLLRRTHVVQKGETILVNAAQEAWGSFSANGLLISVPKSSVVSALKKRQSWQKIRM